MQLFYFPGIILLQTEAASDLHSQQQLASSLQNELQQLQDSCQAAKHRAITVEAERNSMVEELERLLELNAQVQEQLANKDKDIETYEAQVLNLTAELSTLKVNTNTKFRPSTFHVVESDLCTSSVAIKAGESIQSMFLRTYSKMHPRLFLVFIVVLQRYLCKSRCILFV